MFIFLPVVRLLNWIVKKFKIKASGDKYFILSIDSCFALEFRLPSFWGILDLMNKVFWGKEYFILQSIEHILCHRSTTELVADW